MSVKRFCAIFLTALLILSSMLTLVSCGDLLETPDAGNESVHHETVTDVPYAELDKEPFGRDFTVLIRNRGLIWLTLPIST